MTIIGLLVIYIMNRNGVVKMRFEKVQQYLHTKDLDAILIESPINRRYITGFTGTFGSVLITKEEAIFITDFRYTEQANEQA